jgi:hypothetical protein
MTTYPCIPSRRRQALRGWWGLAVFIAGFLLIVAAGVVASLAYGIVIGVMTLMKICRRWIRNAGDRSFWSLTHRWF